MSPASVHLFAHIFAKHEKTASFSSFSLLKSPSKLSKKRLDVCWRFGLVAFAFSAV